MRAVTYLRYSHEKQRKSFSIEEQRDACNKKALADNAAIVREFVDKAESADTIDRPDLGNMISFVMDSTNDIDCLYLLDSSRISRDLKGFAVVKEKLSQKGVIISMVFGMDNSTLEGDLVQDLLVRIAQYDNQLKRAKVKGGMHQRFLNGYALHAVRGYKWSVNDQYKKVIVPDESFNDYQKLWFKIRDEKLTINTALKWFNGFSKHTLTKSSLSRMLENKLYFGVLSYKKYKEEVIACHTPMIDEDTYWQVRSIIAGRSRNNKVKNKINPKYPLTKILLCPACDSKTTAAKSKGKNKYYEYYFCRNRKTCKYNKQVIDVHKAFIEKLKTLIPTDEMMLFIKEMIVERYESYYNDLSHSSREVEKELVSLESKKTILLDKLLDGIITNEVYKSADLKLDSEIISRKILVSEKQLDKLDIETVMNFILYYITHIDKIWERYSIETKIALQSSTFPKGVYFEEKVCRTPEISLAFRSKEVIETLSDPNVRNVEHLERIIQSYEQIYNEMSPYITITS